MYQKLKSYLEIKNLFESSDNQYWNDPYISKNLLNSHLSEHLDSASRNFSFMDSSIVFIEDILMRHKLKTICDFGCGPGLYTEKLALKGFDVTGIDFSKRSIEYAKESAKEKELLINYRYEDYLRIDDTAMYDFASLIYCDYGSLSLDNREVLLKNIYHSLNKDGYFLMDVFSVQKFMLFEESQTFKLQKQPTFWYEKEHLEFFLKQSFENFITLKRSVILSNTETKIINRWYQYFTKEMLVDELEAMGFEVVDVYSNVKGDPYSCDSETIAVLAQKKVACATYIDLRNLAPGL